ASTPARVVVAAPARTSDDIVPAPEPAVVAANVAARAEPFRPVGRARTWLAAAAAVLVAAGAVYGARALRSGGQPPDAAAGTVAGALGSVRRSRAPHEVVTTSSPVAARFFAAGV